MTLIENTNNVNLGIDKNKITVNNNFFAGVAAEGTGTATVNNDGVDFTIDTLKANSQIDLVAENRAVAAAFVNQGTDLISDSLDTISRDDNYGVKTFAAVHGNRSKYDVNSDIKINGWSTIVGVGNAGKFDNGSEFSWGVFYENGSGNYRTFNEFNNEFFRGDGSLVYNGGGIAARYTNKNGVYTEGSLRAGMLKSDMDNALRDGAGNFYGYESESAYYGAHIGIGKIISLSESSDLDIYGKFFHTYTEGDSFKVANDEFEKENKFTTYYGLAYEYEFNGDADMTAQGLKAPTQSLQGSSVKKLALTTSLRPPARGALTLICAATPANARAAALTYRQRTLSNFIKQTYKQNNRQHSIMLPVVFYKNYVLTAVIKRFNGIILT